VADFDGIQLIGSTLVGGGVLTLSADSEVSRIACLPNGIEVEVRQGCSAVVVRGISASDYESAIQTVPEQANKALDIFAMTGQARMALADIWSNQVIWWSASDATVVRVFCSVTLPVSMNVKIVVSSPDGAAISQDVEPAPSWHESMRYFRISEITDDLFDAFRNIYLALESLLSKLEPPQYKEGEGRWLKRALGTAGELVDLRAFQVHPTDEPVNDLYSELWHEIRNSVFHAKSTRESFLPQDTTSRAKVSDAKKRYTRMYLELVYKILGTRYPSGGLYLSTSTVRRMGVAATEGWRIIFREDQSSEDALGDNLSPELADDTALRMERSTDPRGDNFSAVIAKMAVPKVPDTTAIGRIITLMADGQPAFTQNLGGRLTVDGFDRCEFMVSVSAEGRQVQKTLYAT
jgi:hypothetical protein